MRTCTSVRLQIYLSCGNVRLTGVPLPGRFNDFIQRRVARLPSEKFLRFPAICHETRGIAGTALRLPNGNITATCPLHSSNDLTHGVALSRSQVNGSVLAALEHVLERCHVRLGEIHYMRVVGLPCGRVWGNPSRKSRVPASPPTLLEW